MPPRIIIYGGSNVAFGIDSELIQQELGLPVVNLGLHAGLGVVPLQGIQNAIQRGDVIVISLEYEIITNENFTDGTLLQLADWLEASQQNTQYLINPVSELPSIYLIILQNKINRQTNTFLAGKINRGVYSGENFNSNGDMIGHLDIPSKPPDTIKSTAYPTTVTQEDAYIFLEEFNQHALSAGAQVFLEMPASRETNCNATGFQNIKIFYEILLEKTTIPILTPLDQVCLPDKYFFDTVYHLNTHGRQIRTERIISGLRENMPSLFAP